MPGRAVLYSIFSQFRILTEFEIYTRMTYYTTCVLVIFKRPPNKQGIPVCEERKRTARSLANVIGKREEESVLQAALHNTRPGL